MNEGKSKLLQAVQVVRRKIYADVRAQLADDTKTSTNRGRRWVQCRNGAKNSGKPRHLKASRTATTIAHLGGYQWK